MRARLFTGGTRRAIELRDRICTHPYCYEPAENCQADHIEPYAVGGPTTQENGRLLCGFHNRLRNQREQRERRTGATRAPTTPAASRSRALPSGMQDVGAAGARRRSPGLPGFHH